MFSGDQQRCQTISKSPRSLAKMIESCIIRNAFDEECRAQKALNLLKARDCRIAFLEKRVAELEETAIGMHAMSLQASSTLSSLNDLTNKNTLYNLSQSEPSMKFENDSKNLNSSKVENRIQEKKKILSDRTTVPDLKLSPSTSCTDKEILSKSKSDSTRQQISNYFSDLIAKVDTKEIKSRSTTSEIILDNDKEKCLLEDKKSTLIFTGIEKRSLKKDKVELIGENKNEKTHVLSKNRNCNTEFPFRVSSSMAWIRTNRNFRKKIRPFVVRARKQQKGDQRAEKIDVSSFRQIEIISGDDENNKIDIVDPTVDTEVTKKDAVVLDNNKKETRNDTLEEERITADIQKKNVETKTNYTQTDRIWNEELEKNVYTNENDSLSRSTPSLFYNGYKKCTNISVEEPAPQWLIEEALCRGDEVYKEKEWQKDVESIDKTIEYENIITELENKLSLTKIELEDAIRKKSFVKEKYKRIVENVQMEASKENEALQQKIIQICTSVLEKFGSYALSNNKINGSQQMNNPKSSRYFGKLSKRLYKKLRIANSTSKKLKSELSKTRKKLKDKSNEFESLNNCFTLLKQEMETTETNLNDLIAENTSLRKKFEDMKEWMEMKIGKEQNERISATQIRELPKYREIANLKKKSDEDSTTIKQLHNKLLKSESANANKGFLLKNYKNQLSDLTKEKDLFTSKIKELENELTALRTTNEKLKAKISLINEEKENLACKVEKSQTDLKQQIETQINRKYEESMQDEINSIKIKCENAIQILKEKLFAFENKNFEYSKAIKEFLKNIHNHCDEREDEKRHFYGSEVGEREAHETACNILNMTSEELAIFMNEKSNTINVWLADFNKITSKNNFSDVLAKFLFKTTIDKIHTTNSYEQLSQMNQKDTKYL